jgi:hypothetical protein
MTENQQLALLFILTGVMDWAIAFYLGAKMSPVARRMMLFFGSVFLVLGAAMLLGRLRLV